MAIIGQNVQAGLGRIDYTPYLQGASMGAQGIAQGIASIGQGAAKGIQDYFRKQEQDKQEEEAASMISKILKTNPGLSSQLNLPANEKGEFDQGAVKAAIRGAGGPVNAIKLAMTLDELSSQQKASQEKQAATSYASLLSQGGGKVPSPISGETLSKFSPQAKMMGESLYLQGERQRAELDKIKAETQSEYLKQVMGSPSKFVGKLYGSVQDAQADIDKMVKAGSLLPGQVPTVNATSNGYAIEIKGANVPNEQSTSAIKIMEDRFRKNIEAGDVARNLAPAVYELQKLFSEGLDTNKLTPLKIRAMSIGKALGFTVDENQLSKLETAETYTTQQILNFFQQTKGSISNKENDLFALMGPSITKTAETNRKLLGVIANRLNLDQKIADIVSNGVANGVSFAEIERRKQELIAEYDKKIPSIEDLGFGSKAKEVPSGISTGFDRNAVQEEIKRRGLAPRR